MKLEHNNWLIERPSEQVVKVGQTFMSCMYDASIRKSLGGLGGCQDFDLNDFPAEFHDLILAYINEELCSVEAVFIAMRRADKGPGDPPEALLAAITQATGEQA